MKKRYVGRRGPHSTDWVWEEPLEPQTRRDRLPRRWVAALAAAVLIALTAGVYATTVLQRGGGVETPSAVTPPPGPEPTHSPLVQPLATPTPRATESPSPTASPAPAASPSPAPAAATPSPAPSGTLLAWSKAGRSWDSSGAAGRGYREGEAVPLLLVIRNTRPSEKYSVRLGYDCISGGANAIDFLTGMPEAALQEAATAAGGPGRARPDAAIPLPDDPALTFDDARPDPSLRLWGGTFASAPAGPVPSGPCNGGKEVTLAIVARQETVYLLWAAHLASARDWGSGKGAASAQAPFAAGASSGGPSVYVTFNSKDLVP